MKSKSKEFWGWTFIIIGVLSMMFGIFMLYLYFDMKAEMIDESDPETFWNALGLIFAYASLGSYVLMLGLVASCAGLIFITIGIMIMRS